MKRFKFPCGGTHKLSEEQEVHFLREGKRDKTGAFRIGVFQDGVNVLMPTFPDGAEFHCLHNCPTPGAHRKQIEIFTGNGLEMGEAVACHARIFQDGIDVTPPARKGPDPADQCQKAYVKACKAAGKKRQPIPDRAEFGRRWMKENVRP